MDKFFGNLHAVLGAGLVLAIILMLGLNGQNFEDGIAAANAVMRWLHTFFGVLWIGLLYYFNFVQMPTMPKIPAELKPAVGKHIAPAALFWFRWAALATVVLGVAIAAGHGLQWQGSRDDTGQGDDPGHQAGHQAAVDEVLDAAHGSSLVARQERLPLLRIDTTKDIQQTAPEKACRYSDRRRSGAISQGFHRVSSRQNNAGRKRAPRTPLSAGESRT